MSYKGQNRISFKALMHFLVIGIVCICVCAVLLGTDTYAWFYDGMHTDNSVKGSENASMLSVSVYKSGEADAIATVDATEAVTLSLAEGEYSVKLALPKQSASGYLVIGVGEQDYYSDCLQRSETSDQEMTFSVKINTPKSVKLTARWGTHAEANCVQNGETLIIE